MRETLFSSGGRLPQTTPGNRLGRRVFPLVATIGLLVVGVYTTTWGPSMMGRTEWVLPYDLWGTLVAATRLAHLDIGGLYTSPTGLVSLPGAAVILVPIAAVIDAAGLSLHIPGPANPHPAVWLVAAPYEIALCCVTLFAADALAEQLGVARWKRALLSAASAGILWNVSARWGHPEDAVAVGLLLYAILAQSRSRDGLAGWLAGAAVCVQPLVLLALPVMLALMPWRRMPMFLVRAALPSAVLLGAALACQLARHVHVGDQPAQLADHQPPHRVDIPGTARGERQRRRRTRPAGHHRARLLLRAGGQAPLARPPGCGPARRRATAPSARRNARPGLVADPGARGSAVVGRVYAGAALVLRACDGLLLPMAAARGRAYPRRDAQLGSADRRGAGRRRRDCRRPRDVAQRVDLVGAAGRGASADAGSGRPGPSATRTYPAIPAPLACLHVNSGLSRALITKIIFIRLIIST